MSRKSRRGMAFVDVAFGVGATAVVAVIGMQSLPSTDPDHVAARHKLGVSRDSSHCQQIHKAMIAYASQSKGARLPRPGLIDRLPVRIGNGTHDVPGQGEEDVVVNTTANLYSCMIVMNYFEVKTVISPLERNELVKQKTGYDFKKYDPAHDQYWDPTFLADLKTGSNTSYAHMPLAGERAASCWIAEPKTTIAVLGTRGPKDGDRSTRTLSGHVDGPWEGNIVFSDNHVERLTSMQWTSKAATDAAPDNLFATDDLMKGLDCLLAFTKTNAKSGPTLQFD